MAKLHRVLNKFAVKLADDDVVHKNLVNLYYVAVEILQQTQGRIAHAKIVHGYLYAHFAEIAELLVDKIPIRYALALRKLQGEKAGV